MRKTAIDTMHVSIRAALEWVETLPERYRIANEKALCRQIEDLLAFGYGPSELRAFVDDTGGIQVVPESVTGEV